MTKNNEYSFLSTVGRQKEFIKELNGFYGDDNTPIEFDRYPGSLIAYKMRHMHVEGRCCKNRSGRFCN